MTIAIACNPVSGTIAQKFEEAKTFALYDYYGEDIYDCRKTLLNCDGSEGTESVIAKLLENNTVALMAVEIDSASRLALSMQGIIPVFGYSGNADSAADMLVTGTLEDAPAAFSGNAGGCSGCGGSCGENCGGCGGSCGC